MAQRQEERRSAAQPQQALPPLLLLLSRCCHGRLDSQSSPELHPLDDVHGERVDRVHRLRAQDGSGYNLRCRSTAEPRPRLHAEATLRIIARALSPSNPISESPATPKNVWKTSASSSGRSEIPPFSASWQLRMKAPSASVSIQWRRPRMESAERTHLRAQGGAGLGAKARTARQGAGRGGGEKEWMGGFTREETRRASCSRRRGASPACRSARRPSPAPQQRKRSQAMRRSTPPH